MKTPKRRKRPEPKMPRWFIVRRGYAQNYVRMVDGKRRDCFPVFSDWQTCADFIRHSLDNAERLVDVERLSQYRPAEIGTVQGETLPKLLATSMADEALWIHDVRPDTFSFRSMPLREAT
jgi:hypothetical protein